MNSIQILRGPYHKPKRVGCEINYMTEEQAEKANWWAKEGRAALLVYFGSALDFASCYIDSVIESVEKEKWFKYNIKHYGKKSQKLAREQSDAMRKLIVRYRSEMEELYLDILDTIQEDMFLDRDKLYWSVMDVIHKKRLDKAEVRAKIETAGLLLALANRVYTDICKETDKRAAVHVSHLFNEYDPMGIIRMWDEFSILAINTTDADRHDIAENRNVVLACQILLDRIMAQRNIDKNMKKIINLHPELLDEDNTD